MKKKTDSPTLPPAGSAETPEEMRHINRLPVVIHGQYIKDLSLENPHAPASLKSGPGEAARPSMDINFTMDARKIEEEKNGGLYEVTLGVEIQARRQDMIAFIIDLQYAVLVSLVDVPEEQAHPLLLIEMPRYAFPFVRQIISDMTQQAGFMPLLLTPVDFRDFYVQRYGSGAPASAKSA